MLLIHLTKITPRANYIFKVIFYEILKLDFELTSDNDLFLKYSGPKISYGDQNAEQALNFGSYGLLYETGVNKKDIKWETWNGINIFFQIHDKYALPFDIFSASFFLISRYQEYLPHPKDKHGRFTPEESEGYKEKILEIPIINIWAEKLKSILQNHFKDLEFPATSFTFTPTIDIDNAYAFKHKGWRRIFLSMVRNLLHLKFGILTKRTKVITGFKKDPYDSYEYQFKINKTYKIRPYYFILMGNFGKYDRNLSHKNLKFISLIRSLDQHGEVCLHPSYDSTNNLIQIKKEKERLEKIIGHPVTKSRQHYLKINIPHTYRQLIEVGIKEDYSMGYASKVGFRAGTCTPHFFYDIENEKQTDLKIFPFVFMDTTLKTYLKVRSKDAVPYVKPIVEQIKSLRGNLIFIFHNESMGNSGIWKHWGNMYEKMIRLALGK
jgi:hypothetical protein